MALSGSLQDREIAKFTEVNGKTSVNVNDVSENESFIFDQATSTIMYFGYATAGSLTSAASWKIKKIEISGTQVIVTHADSNSNYDNIWDNRASLTYG